MEDFSTLIWIVVIAVAAIASRGRKVRTRPAGQSETEPTQPTDTASNPTPSGWPAWPQIPGFPDLSTQKEPAPRKAPGTPQRSGKHLQTAQKRDISLCGNSGNLREEQSGTAANVGKTTKQPRQPDTPMLSPKSEKLTHGQDEASGAEIAADFDLRRAVIYSEILKPKFDE